jgi:hypothetical protein
MAGPVATKSSQDKSAGQAKGQSPKQAQRPTLSGSQDDLMFLHQTVGNRAVGRMLQAGARGSTAEGNGIPPIVQDVLNSGGGKPLDSTTRGFMESRFGQDFSEVRVHTDAKAAESARAVNAEAYTMGRNVMFGAGQYLPQTSEGRRLLAHELTHVVQQNISVAPLMLQSISGSIVDDPLLEQEAQKHAEIVTDPRISHVRGNTAVKPVTPGTIQRQASGATSTASAAPITPDGINKWPEILPKAQRATGEKIKVTLHGKKIAPTLSNVSLGVISTTLGDMQMQIVKQIKTNRDQVDTSKLSLMPYRSQYGYSYSGTTPVSPSAIQIMGSAPQNRADQVKKLVWEEMRSEGGTSAINAYDIQMLTWGRGFAGAAGTLPFVMKILFKDPEVRNTFLPYGIAYQNGWMVVNTDTGHIETERNALALIQATPQLLGVFIKIAETTNADPAKNLSQKVTNAQWQVLTMRGAAGDVPQWAYQWDDRWIQLVAHISHWWPKTGWSKEYMRAKSIRDILMIWGDKAAGKKEANGAMIVSNADTLGNFKVWGKGVAWQAITSVYAEPMPYVRSQLTDKRNKQFANKLFILAPQNAGYYIYPEKPRLVRPDGTEDKQSGASADYDYFFILNGLSMSDMLMRLKGLTLPELKKKSVAYDGRFGGRVRVAMEVVNMLLRGKAVKRNEKEQIKDDPDFKKLPNDQQSVLRKELL